MTDIAMYFFDFLIVAGFILPYLIGFGLLALLIKLIFKRKDNG